MFYKNAHIEIALKKKKINNQSFSDNSHAMQIHVPRNK